MSRQILINRRTFFVGAAAAGAGLTLGFDLPFGEVRAETEVREINAWVVVRPDDTVVVRIARSEIPS